MDPTYEDFAIHRLIAGKLEDVEAGRLRRLAIFVPPAIGKSRLSSEFFPSWFFGRNPTLEFIETSYDEGLAKSFGRNVRNFLQHPKFKQLFPDVTLAADATAMAEWKTNQEGEYKAEGVGGGLIGFHGHIAMIDDPFKSYESARSENQCRVVWDWYAGVLLNRLRSYKDGPGSVVLIMQRWTENDLGGMVERLMEDGEEEWDIIKVPSIAKDDDLLGREVGTCLLPDGPNRRTLDELDQIRKRNPSMFMAVHQQEPFSSDGDLFKPSDLALYADWQRPKSLTVYGVSDFALTKNAGDYTVHILFGVCQQGHIWILNLYRKQVDLNDGIAKVIDWMLEFEPLQWYFERVSMQKAIGAILTKERRTRGAWTSCVDVSMTGKGKKDSPERAGSIAGAMQLGYLHAPVAAPWLGELLAELVKFPNGRYDDQVDALALIGMKLTDLQAAVVPEEKKGGIFTVEPTGLTFDDYMNMAQRKGKGLSYNKGTYVLPWETEMSPLDPDWVPDIRITN